MNLAGTLPWTHWRGGVVLLALLLGNVACFACPLVAPRGVLRRWIRPTRKWPRRLRSKWIAVALVSEAVDETASRDGGRGDCRR